MDLLVMRHGDAVDDAPGLGDAGRWLSGKGRKTTRAVATWLLEHPEYAPREIWTSPLVRAVQTAEIVAEGLGMTDEVSVLGALAVGGDLREVLARVAAHRGGALMVVGHEPSLSHLATTLLAGDVRWPGFKKSGVLGVAWRGRDEATFRFALEPKDLRLVTEASELR